ncbi:MAG: hypothetical protein ACPG32_08175 [Akkermansiaceae bacterium]
MDTFITIISQPFTWGLLVGLLLAATTWRLMRKDITTLRVENKRVSDENKELQTHLNTQLKINSKGNEQLQEQLDDLREQNENLRNNIHVLKQKPGRNELRHLQIMEAAAAAMREQAPGFAPAWEKSLREAETAHEAAEGGFKKLIRKVIPSAISTTTSSPAHEAKNDDQE